ASMICVVMRRMNALSSTIRTRGSLEDTRPLPERPHFDAAVGDGQVNASTVVAARVLGDDRDLRAGEDIARGHDVPFTDVDAARWDEVCEHAAATDDLRANT